MKRLFWLALAAITISPVLKISAQARYDSNAWTAASNVPIGTQAPLFSVPYATVKICTTSSCSALQTVYSDQGLTMPITQPFKADALGRYGFWTNSGTYWQVVCAQNGKCNQGFLTVGGTGGSGSGTVTSVALTLPNLFNVTGSPITTAGTLAATLATQSANQVFAGPSSGSAAAPTFRALVSADIPAINLAASGNGGVTGLLPNANLANPSITINSVVCTLGGSCTISGGGGGIGGAGTTGFIPVFTNAAAIGNSHLSDISGILAATEPFNLSGTTTPLLLNGSAGTTGQIVTSAGAGATPTWGSGSSGTVSGQAANVIPLGTSATVIGNQSHLSDNGTTVSSSLPFSVAVSGGQGGTFDASEGTAATPVAGHDKLYADSTNHCMEYSANGGSFTCLGTGGGTTVDSRPRATDSVVGPTIGPGGTCLIATTANTSGTQVVNACLSASPAGTGTITHLHLTLGPVNDFDTVVENSTLTITCDGSTTIVPLSMLFMTKDQPPSFTTDWIDDSLGGFNNGFSGNRRTEINYSSGCSVTFTNGSSTGSVMLFSEVDYKVGANTSRPSRQHWHAYVAPITALAPFTNLQMLPGIQDAGGGELESETLWTNGVGNGGLLEGFPTVTADGNVVTVSGGVEDYYCSGFDGINPQGGHFTPKCAEFYASGWNSSNYSLQNQRGLRDALFYRNFQTNDEENLFYTTSLSAITPNGASGKPGAGNPGNVNMMGMVTYWTHDITAAPVTFSPVSGVVTTGSTVTLSTTTTGATICYTTDGSIPTSNGAGTCTHGTAGTSLSVTTPATVTAIATKSGFASSDVTSAYYTSTSAPYTFKGTVFGANNSTPALTVTSSSITIAAGDFVFVNCATDSVATKTVSFTASSSTANTFWSLPETGFASTAQMEAFYVTSAVAGTYTFTCTTSANGGFSSIIVLDYSYSGPGAQFMPGTDFASATACGSFGSTTATCISPTFTLPSPGLVIQCGQVPALVNWTAGTMAGAAGTMRGAAGSGFTSVNPACADAEPTTSAVGTTSSITSSAAESQWLITGGAFR